MRYHIDSQGSRAHWLTAASTKARAIERAQSMIRYPGDQATVYRDRAPILRYWIENVPGRGNAMQHIEY